MAVLNLVHFTAFFLSFEEENENLFERHLLLSTHLIAHHVCTRCLLTPDNDGYEEDCIQTR